MIHIVKAKVCGHYELALTFSDGSRKRVNIAPLLHGPVFEPLRDPSFFSQVQVDPVTGTVAWPNETDLAKLFSTYLLFRGLRTAKRRAAEIQ